MRPAGLAAHISPVGDFAPNAWNPNRMDDFMRAKLSRAICKDGFFMPVHVRPHPTQPDKWEIVDGEHRWLEAKDTLHMEVVPNVNLGPISDEKAKQITIKANTLRGEFDSVELGRMIKDLVDAEGMAEVAGDLPYTPERLQGLVDLVSGNLDLTAPSGPMGGDDEKKPENDGAGNGEFKRNSPVEGIDLAELIRSLDDMKFDSRWLTLPLRKRTISKKARAAGCAK